jgi:hypothetical protein
VIQTTGNTKRKNKQSIINKNLKPENMANRETTKSRTFEIPKDFIGTFFSQLEDSDLEYTLSEIDEDNEELIIEVEYSPSQREVVMNLIELLDDYQQDDDEDDDEN